MVTVQLLRVLFVNHLTFRDRFLAVFQNTHFMMSFFLMCVVVCLFDTHEGMSCLSGG